MTSLHIMVAYGGSIILHIVDYLGSYILVLGVDVVVEIAYRLTLQNVAIIEQQHILAMLLSQVVDICANPCKASCLWLATDEVVREEASVHIRSFYNLYFHSLCFVLCVGC